MSDGSLSQEEIDALLQGVDDMGVDSGGGAPAAPQAAAAAPQQAGLSETAKNEFLEIINKQLNNAANTLSTIISKTVSITNTVLEIKTADELRQDFTGDFVQIKIDFTEGLSGKVLYVLKKDDAGVIADLMMGQDGSAPPAEFSDLYSSAIGEAISQINGGGLNDISDKLGRAIKVAPPQVEVFSDPAKLLLDSASQFVKVISTLNVEGVITNSYLYEIYPIEVVNEITASADASEVSYTSAPAPQQAAASPAAAPVQQQVPQVNVRPVELPQLNIPNLSPEQAANIQLLMDVPMHLTVELGRTRMLVKEILGLGEGSIIELDKLAGEPVDLLINNKLIAKGEVVVIDENFGVRVTDIVNPVERLASLKSG